MLGTLKIVEIIALFQKPNKLTNN